MRSCQSLIIKHDRGFPSFARFVGHVNGPRCRRRLRASRNRFRISEEKFLADKIVNLYSSRLERHKTSPRLLRASDCTGWRDSPDRQSSESGRRFLTDRGIALCMYMRIARDSGRTGTLRNNAKQIYIAAGVRDRHQRTTYFGFQLSEKFIILVVMFLQSS